MLEKGGKKKKKQKKWKWKKWQMKLMNTNEQGCGMVGAVGGNVIDHGNSVCICKDEASASTRCNGRLVFVWYGDILLSWWFLNWMFTK